jgi:hypothetical protein
MGYKHVRRNTIAPEISPPSSIRPLSSPRVPRWLRGALLSVLFFSLPHTPEVAALPFLVIDQRNDDVPTMGGFGIFGAAPLGQEFAPSLAALDTVEIVIGPRDSSTVAVVNVRKDSITGALVGTSLPGTIEERAVHFDFAARVPLVPGDRYVLEPVVLSGGGFGPVFSDADTYAGGRGIAFGTHFPIETWASERGSLFPSWGPCHCSASDSSSLQEGWSDVAAFAVAGPASE